jgi:hypothetical protein
MARRRSLEAVILDAVAPVVARIVRQVDAVVAKAAAAEARRRAAAASRARPAARRRRGEITRWVADRRARRVPTFVIEMTGLDTKKKIVARFGEDAAFAKGKPLPAVPRAADAKAEVKAKGPTIRKKAAAA